MEEKRTYTGYEYKTVIVSRGQESLWKDSENCLGWQLEKERPAIVKKAFGAIRVMTAPLAVFGGRLREIQQDHISLEQVELTFKRDRSLASDKNLQNLQKQFEEHAENIEKINRAPKRAASIWGYGVGLVGTVFMGGATFAMIAGLTMQGVVLAVPGFAGWLLSGVVYHKVKQKKQQEAVALTNEKQEKISRICENAVRIIQA